MRKPRHGFDEFMGGESGVAPQVETEDAPRDAPRDVPPAGKDWVSGDGVPELDYMLEGVPLKGEPRLPGPYVRIIRTVFRIDEEDIFKRATEQIAFARKAHLVDYGEIVDALNEASDIATKCAQLLQNAKVVAKRYRADVETLRSDMRARAVAALQAEKPEKGGKTITDADVVARMAGSFPDEYRRQEELLARVEGFIAFVSQLVDDWGARRRELEGMMRTSRKVS